MRSIFITGTDTGIGKTTVARLLRHHLLKKGHTVVIQKWIETGFKGKKKSRAPHSLTRPYLFSFASSPHLAAKMERRRIDIRKIKESYRILSRRFDFVIVEGTGGVLVPVDTKTLMIDIARSLNIPVLIVAGNRLGVINHALLTIEALKARKITICGIIFNVLSKNVNRLVLEDNPKIVGRLGKEDVLGVLPQAENASKLNSAFKPIGDRIIARL